MAEKKNSIGKTDSSDMLERAARSVGTTLGSVAAAAGKVIGGAKDAVSSVSAKPAGKVSKAKPTTPAAKRAASKKKKKASHRRALKRSNTSG